MFPEATRETLRELFQKLEAADDRRAAWLVGDESDRQIARPTGIAICLSALMRESLELDKPETSPGLQAVAGMLAYRRAAIRLRRAFAASRDRATAKLCCRLTCEGCRLGYDFNRGWHVTKSTPSAAYACLARKVRAQFGFGEEDVR